MSSPCLVLGIDLGTSGVRIAVINQKKQLIQTVASDYPRGLAWTEDWRSCCIELINSLPSGVRSQLRAIAVDGTSGTLVACKTNGEPLTEALLYNHAYPEHSLRIKQLVSSDSSASSVSSSLARALQLTSELGDDLLLRHQADWVTGWLMNNWSFGEEGNNLKLGWDLSQGDWPKSFNSMPWKGALPKIIASGKIMGNIAHQQAKALGVPLDLVVVAGSTDANAAFLAADAGPNEGVTVLGSTVVLKRFVDKPIKGKGITNHRVEERWLCGGSSNAGGAVLRKLFSDSELKELSRQINPEENSGLFLRPLPGIGERFPVDDPTMTPIMAPRPISDALYLHGILEGLARIEAAGWQRLCELGAPPAKGIITLGGGARNPQWRKIRERIIGLPIRSSSAPPASGVARIALRALQNIMIRKNEAGESNPLT